MSSTPSLSYLGDLVRQYDRDRFLTTLFVPPRIRNRLHTLYAFNSEIARIREAVSEPIIGQIRLQWWRDVLSDLEEGKAPPKGHPVAEPLADLIEDSSLSIPLFKRLLEARKQDLEDAPIETLSGLREYCRSTSSTLSVLALECLGVRDVASKEAAEAVGLAWALTGILRTVRHLALAGKTMLPAQLLSKSGLSIQELRSPDSIERLRPVIQTVAHEAKNSIDAARCVSGMVNHQALPVLLPATLSSHYLRDMERKQYDIFHRSLKRQRPAIVRLCWSAWRKIY
ncbi:MAG: phytoene/squalene synthase family protein [Rhodospirillaceae bacterium]|jgi:NADH dehydrogenase [ubiquinone] 1 alpha subcomplex assembly factor 6|nr:phytoene/squalene synthase family protein [Rhodospirillaceae bacterium]